LEKICHGQNLETQLNKALILGLNWAKKTQHIAGRVGLILAAGRVNKNEKEKNRI
jgi:hypothetical protein